MFDTSVYIDRRNSLKSQLKSGLVVLLGNSESPMNYPGNTYYFRQDSSFLYFYGLDVPDLTAVIDIDNDRQIIFGDEQTVDQKVWVAPQPSIAELAATAGITQTAPITQLAELLQQASAKQTPIHFLPITRADNQIKMSQWTNLPAAQINQHASIELVDAVVNLRSYKSVQEIKRIEIALEMTTKMHTFAMQLTKPGLLESEIVAAIEAVPISKSCRPSFSVIFSIHGQTLHNLSHVNTMKDGDIVVNDCGAECSMHYAGDMTRTIPVGGKFTQKQKEIYSIVLDAQQKAIDAVKPGTEFRDIHLLACRQLAVGLKELGLMKGDIDDAVANGAHALFMPCGLGHMMGLDVHDMEGLGEDRVGYTDTIKRSPQFGLKSLRMARALEPDFVMTVEPGIYFIPQLIDLWQSQNINADFINFDLVNQYRDFGGVRIEDDLLVTKDGYRILGAPVPKQIEDVEAMCAS
ncbi:MAG: aminopeptidase P family protein [Anaerohalosphaera sp.]|nr:aminopeptidase P family protein [Anaerohalosphaera sp.]